MLCSLATPDTVTVMYVRLLSFGFEGALSLARKMAALYTLLEERLPHHRGEFGMRNVVAVLRALCAFKREDAYAPEVVRVLTHIFVCLPEFIQVSSL